MRQVVATLAAVHEIILVAASDGTLAADVRPLVRMNVSVIVEQNGRREQGYAGTGGRYSEIIFPGNIRVGGLSAQSTPLRSAEGSQVNVFRDGFTQGALNNLSLCLLLRQKCSLIHFSLGKSNGTV